MKKRALESALLILSSVALVVIGKPFASPPPGAVPHPELAHEEVMRRVREAFRPKDGAFLGTNGSRAYTVRVDGPQLRLRPGSGQPADAFSDALSLGPTRVELGSQRLALDASGRERDVDGSLVLRSSGAEVVERLRNTAAGLEQTWEFPHPLNGEGDLLVRVPVQGKYLGASAGGLHFETEASGTRVRYGHGTWVDAEGRRSQVPAEFIEGAIALRVPAKTLRASRYPAVLDPIVSPEIAFDAPVAQAVKGPQSAPSIAFDGENYLVVWEEEAVNCPGDLQIFGARFSPSGEVLDPLGIEISFAERAQKRPQVVFQGSEYLVVWEDHRNVGAPLPYEKGIDVYGARLSRSGEVLNPFGIPIAWKPGSQLHPELASNGERALVVWQDDANTEQTGVDIRGAFMLEGVSYPTAHFAIADGSADELLPSVSTLKGEFLVAWQDARNAEQTGPDIYAARVNAEGARQEASGFAVSTAPGAQTHPDVTASDLVYLIAWNDEGSGQPDTAAIHAARMRPDGSLLDETSVEVSVQASPHSRPAAIFDGSDFLLAYQGPGATGVQSDLFGAWVSGESGAVLSRDFALSNAAIHERVPALASNGRGVAAVAYDVRETVEQAAGVRARLISGKGQGESCDEASDCKSHNCVDGVCCDSACGGGDAGDCMACSVSAGAGVDGTCAPLEIQACLSPETTNPEPGQESTLPEAAEPSPIIDLGPVGVPAQAAPDATLDSGEESKRGYSGWDVGCSAQGGTVTLTWLSVLLLLVMATRRSPRAVARSRAMQWGKAQRAAVGLRVLGVSGLVVSTLFGGASPVRAAPLAAPRASPAVSDVPTLARVSESRAVGETEPPIVSQTVKELPPVPPENAHARMHLLGSAFVESVSRQMGGEVGATLAVNGNIDLGAALVLGSSVGYRALAEWHPKRAMWASPLLPFLQVRGIVHPVPEGVGVGAGAWGGASLELGPGRVRGGVLGEGYSGPRGYHPFAAFAMFGYEVDLLKPTRVLEYRDRVTEIVRERRVPEPVRASRLRCLVTDMEDRPLQGSVRVTRVDGSRAPVDLAATPECALPLEPGAYVAEASSPGFLNRGRQFVIEPGETRVEVFQLRANPPEPVAKLTSERIEVKQRIDFEFDKATLLASAAPILDEVVDILLKHPELSIRVEGHTCSIGSAEYNQTLSDARAETVVNYLVEHGIERARLTPQGYGLTRPIAGNKTEAERARNRRVQFEIVPNENPSSLPVSSAQRAGQH